MTLVWSTLLYGYETWTLRKNKNYGSGEEVTVEAIGENTYTERVANKEVQIFSEKDLSRAVGIVEISDLQLYTSTCKVLEGEETIGMLLDNGTKLYAIQIKNLILKK